ncbi:MAG: beta-lactamase family protein [Oscillospiraceae bacterium]|nr:beta-lactamase family protein [Oscillospiraceae bacterium]
MDFTNLKNYMDELTAWEIPGNTIRVFKDNIEVFRYSSGYRDVKTRMKMQGDELFNLYSCSKVALAAAVMQLNEQKRIEIDAPLYDYIPEFRDMYYRDVDGNVKKTEKSLTVRHLLTMTSGFDYNLESDAIKEAKKITNGRMDTVTLVKCLSKQILDFKPGERWQYGLSHDILAGLVETVSGMKFRDYMSKNIFEPVGMKEIYYHAPESVKEKTATQYQFLTPGEAGNTGEELIKTPDGKGFWRTFPENVMWFVLGEEHDSGGAGITTDVDDYVKLAVALSNNGVCGTGERILSEESVNLMKTNQLDDKQIKSYTWEQLAGYGYGLGVRTLIDKSSSPGSLGEFGWDGAAGAFFLVDTDNHLAYLYAQHMLNSRSEIIEQKLRNIVYSCF